MRKNDINDLIGQTFGEVTILQDLGTKQHRTFVWGRCGCGQEREFMLKTLKSGITRSCGHLKRKRVTIESFINKKFGKLLIIKEVEPAPHRDAKRQVLAKCDCGSENVYNLRSVRRGKTRSCGCLRKEIFYNKNKHLLNTKFGRLTILELISERKVLCLCKCGNQHICQLDALKQNLTQSCGCLNREINQARRGEFSSQFKHGLRRHPLYKIYHHLLSRCYNPNDAKYKDYGRRGIYVDDNWLGQNGFINFYNDMVLGYKKELSIDRIDNNGPYSKQNCRWATQLQQGRNKRNNKLIEYNGQTKCLSEWAEIYKIDQNILWTRFKNNWTVDEALTTPVIKQQKNQENKM